jgi:preprotein translocase subunit Sec61beta
MNQLTNIIDRIGFGILKVFLIFGIIACVLGVVSYFKEGDSETLKLGGTFTIILIIMLIVAKIVTGAS